MFLGCNKQYLFQEMYVCLEVISWCEEEFGLYDYRSQSYEDAKFKGNKYRFPIPLVGKPDYYFIHQSTVKNTGYPFMFEHRKARRANSVDREVGVGEEEEDPNQPSSNSKELDKMANYRLIGGFKLQSSEQNRKKKIVEITAISANKIRTKGAANRRQECHPFWVVRSLPRWVVRQKQIIKFGKLQLQVEEEFTDRNRQHQEELQRGQIIDLDQKYLESSHLRSSKEKTEAKRCRVCYGEEEDEENKNILINPCNCRGSIQYIHIECLRQWLESRLTKISLESGGNLKVTSKNCCELCRMRFPSRIIKNGKVMAIVSFMEEGNPYVCFSPVNIAELRDTDKFYVSFGVEAIVRIGRLDDSGLYLADQTVSRKHAILQIQQSGPCILKDEESKYGTLAYEAGLTVRLSPSLRAFQINNSVFCFTCK